MAAAPPADPVPGDGHHLTYRLAVAAHPAALARAASASATMLDTMSAAGAGVLGLHPDAVGSTRGA